MDFDFLPMGKPGVEDARAGDPARLARFAREARVLAALNHPNIAGIHGLEEAVGVTALVLELVEGPTIADRLASGAIPLDESLAIARQIADALDAAHEQGIVHRDLKPHWTTVVRRRDSISRSCRGADRAADLSAVPPRVRHLVARCLEKDPKKRLRDIGDAMSLVADGSAHAPVVVRARRWPAVALVAAGALVVLSSALLQHALDDPAETPDPPTVRLQIPRASVGAYNSAASALAVSPDGRFLAHYVNGANGRATLAVQTLATGERREVRGPECSVLSPRSGRSTAVRSRTSDSRRRRCSTSSPGRRASCVPAGSAEEPGMATA